jgi:hypothetical protein
VRGICFASNQTDRPAMHPPDVGWPIVRGIDLTWQVNDRERTMADHEASSGRQQVRMEDVMEVGSRVSWGAILAGAVLALATCFVLQLIGQAIGVSISDRMSRDKIGFGAAVWASLTLICGLFVGGWVTSQCVVGETNAESVVHGIIMWGVSLALLLWATSSGVNSNFTAMMQLSSIAGVTTEPGGRQSFQSTPAAPIPQEQTARVAEPSGEASRPDSAVGRYSAAEEQMTARATWWTLVTTITSIGGALLGAGPEFRLLPLRVTHRQFSTRTAIPGGA